MDPPWKLSSSAPIRGVKIKYETIHDKGILELPIQKLHKNGYLFFWTINSKYFIALEMMKKWGYTPFDEISWVKKSTNGKLMKGNGFYLQHSKEICIVGVKGHPRKELIKGVLKDRKSVV